jgi:hypothetical protein
MSARVATICCLVAMFACGPHFALAQNIYRASVEVGGRGYDCGSDLPPGDQSCVHDKQPTTPGLAPYSADAGKKYSESAG